MVAAVFAVTTVTQNIGIISRSVYRVLTLCWTPEWLHTRIFLECSGNFIPFSR